MSRVQKWSVVFVLAIYAAGVCMFREQAEAYLMFVIRVFS